MKESEGWFILAEEIEGVVDGAINRYICHILRDIATPCLFSNRFMEQTIPATTAAKMLERFEDHIAFDNRREYIPFDNPYSWYQGGDILNEWRVMACAYLGFEALDEGN